MAKNDLEQAKDIVRDSGHMLHARVLRSLREAGWSVLVSPYYNDTSSGKPREIDLIAEKAFPVVKEFDHITHTVNVRLCVECKYMRETTVFWMSAQDEKSTLDLLENRVGLKRDNVYTLDHHYLASTGKRVAKLFARSKTKAGDEQEPMFKALTQSLNALVAHREISTVVPALSVRRPVRVLLSYPVIVCNDFANFFAVDIEKEEDPRSLVDSFVFEINYAYQSASGWSATEYFLVDVVSLAGLPRLLKSIEDTDVTLLGNHLSVT